MSKTNIYTAFCQQADGGGTIWISTVHADPGASLETIRRRALEACAEDWGMNPASGDIHCLGIARGNVPLVFWHDLEGEEQPMGGLQTMEDSP